MDGAFNSDHKVVYDNLRFFIAFNVIVVGLVVGQSAWVGHCVDSKFTVLLPQ